MESWWRFGEGSGYRGHELEYRRLECAFCNVEGNFSPANQQKKAHSSNGKVLHFDTLKCGNCANYLMVFWSGGDGLYDFIATPHPLNTKPKPAEEWPPQVGRFWSQARRALKNEDLDAAAVMARSALQVALRANDAEGRTLQAEIVHLAQTGLLPTVMKEWADELRLLANSSAHPRPADADPKREDVADLIEFLEFLLRYLFTLPDRIAKYRGRRVAGAE